MNYEDRMKLHHHLHFHTEDENKTQDIIRICTITTPSCTIDLRSGDRSESMDYLVSKSIEVLSKIVKS